VTVAPLALAIALLAGPAEAAQPRAKSACTRAATYGTQIAATPGGVVVEASRGLAVWDGSAWSIAAADRASRVATIGGIAAFAGEVLVASRRRIVRREGTALRSYDARSWRELMAMRARAGATSGPEVRVEG